MRSKSMWWKNQFGMLNSPKGALLLWRTHKCRDENHYDGDRLSGSHYFYVERRNASKKSSDFT